MWPTRSDSQRVLLDAAGGFRRVHVRSGVGHKIRTGLRVSKRKEAENEDAGDHRAIAPSDEISFEASLSFYPYHFRSKEAANLFSVEISIGYCNVSGHVAGLLQI
jgi:hypothetical protein